MLRLTLTQVLLSFHMLLLSVMATSQNVTHSSFNPPYAAPLLEDLSGCIGQHPENAFIDVGARLPAIAKLGACARINILPIKADQTLVRSGAGSSLELSHAQSVDYLKENPGESTSKHPSEAEELAAIRDFAGEDAREDWVSGRPIPHPSLYLGPSLLGGGYGILAYTARGAVNIEATHFIFGASGGYDNGHKVDDGTGPNPKGHDRYLDGGLYLRPAIYGWSRRLYFGGGYTWSQLSTTNYTKGGARYYLGGGYDLFLRACIACRRDLSMRINMNWLTAGTDWQNGSHGPSTSITMPSPREKRHWFLSETLSIYRFHQTITEPTNLPLVQFQEGKKSFDGFADFGVIYRF